MADSLPAEVNDRIIDFLYDDARALAACSLTCQAWLPTARYHRWANTRLRSFRVPRFIELLVGSPSLATYVTGLEFQSRVGSFGRRTNTLMKCNPVELDMLLNRLPFLHHLSLESWHIEEELAVVARANRTFQALKSLSFVQCDFTTLNTAAALMVTPSLTSISLCNLEDLSSELPWIPEIGTRPSIQRLSLSGLQSRAICDLFEWFPRCISSFEIQIQSEEDVPVAGRMLSKIGSSGTLTELDLLVDTDNNLQAVFGGSEFSLECLLELRKCRLAFNLREMFVAGNMSLPWITTIIGQLSSKHLEEITLSIRADNLQDLRALDSECGVRETYPVQYDDLEALDWEALGSSIVYQLPKLRRVTIEGRGDPLYFLSFMSIQHPKLRGLLQLRTVKEQ
ncbi:hypothetical protein BDW22DRAFT_1352493 [Trametopsis cervina]|nr:hypothetical protein BDW22DRAFT_1352493 [Trametopsis cervina]